MGGSVTMGAGAAALEREEGLLLAREVAAMFGVDPKTVRRWAKAGKLTSIRTPGGHGQRFREAEIRALLRGSLSLRDED